MWTEVTQASAVPGPNPKAVMWWALQSKKDRFRYIALVGFYLETPLTWPGKLLRICLDKIELCVTNFSYNGFFCWSKCCLLAHELKKQTNCLNVSKEGNFWHKLRLLARGWRRSRLRRSRKSLLMASKGKKRTHHHLTILSVTQSSGSTHTLDPHHNAPRARGFLHLL